MKVVHCKKSPYDVYIGRPSKYGNPFSHKEGTLAKFKTKDINESIIKYKEYILNGEGKHLLEDIEELRGKTLGCWCGNFTIEDNAHMKCHGQVLMEILQTKKLF